MPQCSEISLTVNVGHGSHALGIVPDPDTDLIFFRLILYRIDFNIKIFFAPPDRQNRCFSTTVFDPGDQIILVRHFRAVQFHHIIAAFQNMFRRSHLLPVDRTELSGTYDHYPFGLDIDSDGNTYRDQLLILDHPDPHLLKRQDPEQLHLHLKAVRRPGLHSHRLTQIQCHGTFWNITGSLFTDA